MAECVISRDQNNEIQEVYAPNNKPSRLFRDVLDALNNRTKEGKDTALKVWARAYTPTFKNAFGDWESVSEALSHSNNIKGNNKDNFIKDPQRALFDISIQSQTSKSENNSVISTFGSDIVRIAKKLFPNVKLGDKYNPLVSKTLDENGEPLARYILNAKEKKQWMAMEIEENPQMSGQTLAQKMSEKMGIPVEFDPMLNKLGAVVNGKVILNPNNLTNETVFHEFSHLFIEAIKVTNPALYNNLTSRAANFTYQNKSIRDFVIENYPDLDPNSQDFNSEVITTAIGLEANMKGSIDDRIKFTQWLQTIIRKIAEYINSLIEDPLQHINPEDLDINMTINDLATLMKIDNKVNLDSLSDRNFTADQVASMDTPVQQTWGSRSTINFFEDKQQAIELVEDGDTSYYINGTIDPVTHVLRRFTRLTEFTYSNFADTEDKDPFDQEKYLDKLTTRAFRDANADLNDKISYGQSEEPLTYDEVKQQIKQNFEEARYKGKIIHKHIEGYLKFKDINYFQDDINKLRQEGGISEYDLLWFDEKKIQQMLTLVGINSDEFNNTDVAFRDNIASELMMVNETLNIGTSNDGIVEHSDGSVSFMDYKTGTKFLADEHTIRRMQYTDGLVSPVFDSRLSRAKIELVMRMIIAKMNKPDLKVRDLKIAYISRSFGTQVRYVDVQEYLDFINNNYRISIQQLKKQVKKQPELHEVLKQKIKEYNAMKSAKVFDFYNYQGDNKIFEQDSDLQTITDPNKKVEFLKNKVANAARQSLLKDGEPGVGRDALRSVKNAVLTVLNSVKALNITSVESAGTEDISYFASKTLGLRDQKNAYLQSFSQLYEESVDSSVKRMENLLGEQSEFRKADRALYKEYFQRTGKTIKSPKTFSYSQGNVAVPLSEQGVFDFMYTWKNVAGESKRIGATYTEQDYKDGKITKAQWDYYQASKKILKELYEGVRNKTAYINKFKKAVTYGEEYIKNDGFNYKTWEESFLPTIPFQNIEEILEKNILTRQLNPITIGKEYYENYRDRYDMAIQNEDRFNIGIPLKYMSSEFMDNDDHSHNVTQAVDIFARHMIQKLELDDTYNIGMTTIAAMSDITDPNVKDRKNKLLLENSIFALQSFLNQQILGRRRMTLKYTKNEVANKRIDRFIDGIGGFMSKNAFWFAPVTAAFNGLYGLFTNVREGLIGSLSARLFGDENAITLTHLAEATKEVGIHQGKNLTKQSNIVRTFNEDWEGSYYKDKVNFMSKMFRLSNKNYTYTDTSLMLGVHNRIFTGDSAYVAQGLGEDLSNEILVVAALKAQKVYKTSVDESGKAVKSYLKKDGTYTSDSKDKNLQNMWDAYEYNTTNGQYEYKGPTRFIDKNGEEVKGITTLETLKVKTYLERVYGAYSPEQKTHLERYALGRMMMKFRKFWIMNIKENFTLNSHQKYVGEYKQLFNADGSPKLKDGQPMYDWQSEAMRSRVLVFASLFGSIWNAKGSKPWSEMSIEEKKQFIRFSTQLVFYGLSIALGMGAFIPPEDQEKLYAKRIIRLTEDLSAVSLVDILRGTTTIDSYPTQLYKAVNATGTFINSVLTDDIVQKGPYAGDYKGWNTLEDFIPIYHASNQTIKLLSGE